MNDRYVLKKNKGNFFTENNVTVPRKGKININDNERYGSILKYQGNENIKDKYEFVISLGLLHYNSPEEKRSERTPDIGGKITVPETDLSPLVDAIDKISEENYAGDYALLKADLSKALNDVTVERIYKFGGWASKTKDGLDYTSIKLTPCDREGNPIVEETETTIVSDESIPF
mgnify:FL=1|jgi:hypothetical protein|tara:strand:- start:4449 stop:4970 length:522 start_codon:yes stop_codon:yes gene_type:complete